MSKKVILKKDVHSIEMDRYHYESELKEMQGWVNWLNSLYYVDKLTEIEEIKQFLSSTKDFHETKTIKFLKTKVQELPPNLNPLKEMYNISDCENNSFSENPHFEYLELKDGELIYSQSLYNEIEAKHTIEATPEQARTLKKLDTTYNNCMRLCEVLAPSKTYKQIYESAFKQAFGVILKQRKQFNAPDDGNNTRFNLNILNLLTEKNY